MRLAEEGGCDPANASSNVTLCLRGLVAKPSVAFLGDGDGRKQAKVLSGGYYPEFSFGGPCFRDRGAPLYTVKRSMESGRAVASLVGIASVGASHGGCADKNAAFPVTDFKSFLPWVTEVMLIDMSSKLPSLNKLGRQLLGQVNLEDDDLSHLTTIVGRLVANRGRDVDANRMLDPFGRDKEMVFPVLVKSHQLGHLLKASGAELDSRSFSERDQGDEEEHVKITFNVTSDDDDEEPQSDRAGTELDRTKRQRVQQPFHKHPRYEDVPRHIPMAELTALANARGPGWQPAQTSSHIATPATPSEHFSAAEREIADIQPELMDDGESVKGPNPGSAFRGLLDTAIATHKDHEDNVPEPVPEQEQKPEPESQEVTEAGKSAIAAANDEFGSYSGHVGAAGTDDEDSKHSQEASAKPGEPDYEEGERYSSSVYNLSDRKKNAKGGIRKSLFYDAVVGQNRDEEEDEPAAARVVLKARDDLMKAAEEIAADVDN